MRRFLFILFFLLILIPVAVVVFAPLIPLDRFAPQIQAQLEKATGLPVQLGGKLRAQILPSVSVKAEDVRIGNHPDFMVEYANAPDLLTVSSLKLNLSLSDLIKKRVKIESASLDTPTINLMKKPNGDFNWVGQNTSNADSQSNTYSGSDDGSGNRGGDVAEQFSLDSLNIENAAITYWDLSTGASQEVTDLSILIEDPGQNAKTIINYKLRFNEEALAGNIVINPLSALLNGNSAGIKATLAGDFGLTQIETSLNPADFDVVSADINLSAVKPSALINLAGLGDEYAQFGNLLQGSVNGDLQVTKIGEQLDVGIDGVSYQLDNNKASFSGSLTQVAGALALFGDVSADIPDVVELVNNNKQVIKLPDGALNSVANGGPVSFRAKSSLTMIGDQISFGELLANVDGAALSLKVQGDASVSSGNPGLGLNFESNVQDISNFASLAEGMGVSANVVSLLNDAGSLVASGSVSFRGQDLSLANLNADLNTPSGNVAYSGNAKNLINNPELQGRFKANTPSVVRMVSLLAPDIMVDVDAFQNAMSGAAQASSEIYFADGSLRLDGLMSSIKGPNIDAGFNGRISANTASSAIEARGDLKSNVTSAKTLARAFGVDLPGGPDVYQKTSINGQVSYETNRIRIQNAEIALDDIRSGLNLDANFNGPKPSIAIGFAADNIDLNKYISGETHEQVVVQESQNQNQRSLESSWSNDPIDVSVLRTFDLDMTAVVNGLKYGGYEFGHTEATATVQNGQAEINLPDTSIFGGKTGANVKINAQNQTPSFALRGDLNGVRAKAALESLLRIDRVDGIANLALDVQSIGGSEAQLMRNLSGTARADIDEGALLGFDIRKTMANVRQGILTPVKGDNEKTTFSTASLGFNINQGIAETNDIKFWSPVLKVTGGGQMDLPNRQMRMELPVELGVFRQDGSAETKTLVLPLQVVGSWVDPNVRLNADALLQSFLQNPDSFLGLLPKGLGVDNLFKDGQNVQQVISQQRDKIEQKAQEELQRIQQQAQDKIQEEAAGAAQKLADELGGQLGGQIGEQLNQQITQGLGGNVGEQGQGIVNNILQNPNVQQKLEQEAGNLLNNLFGN